MISNRSTNGGGGIDCAGGSLTIADTELVDNDGGDGGGISATDCGVTVSGSLFDDNHGGFGSRGGAIFFDGAGTASLQVSNTTITRSYAFSSGGAIFITDAAGQITASTIRESRVTNQLEGCGTNDFHTGGGITVDTTATLALTDTTLLDNCADQFGGGVHVLGSLTLNSSTVRCNFASTASGGLNLADGSEATITNSTISQNASAVGAGINAVLADLTLTNSTIAGQLGDGLGMVTTFATVDVTNTVFGDPCAQLPSSTINSGGGNVEPLGQTCVDAPLGSDQSVADLGLGPLGDFGGPTHTHMPLLGSPVIGAAVDGSCPATDQRGLPRNDCDSGSVELQVGDPEPIFIDDTECMGAANWSSISP